jgi:hypothetical protein
MNIWDRIGSVLLCVGIAGQFLTGLILAIAAWRRGEDLGYVPDDDQPL